MAHNAGDEERPPALLQVRVRRPSPSVTGLLTMSGFVLALVAMGADLTVAVSSATLVTVAADRLAGREAR
jgi:hypothetical protein